MKLAMMTPSDPSTSNLSGPQRRRPPPRLRTKTGCLTCEHAHSYYVAINCSAIVDVTGTGRQRRKKCNEQRPRCDGCSRNKISCTWRSTQPDDCAINLPDKGRASLPHSSQTLDPPAVVFFGETERLVEDVSKSRSPQLTWLPFSWRTTLGLNSSLEVRLLQHFLLHTLPNLISVNAHPIFKDHSLVLLSTMHVRSARNALFAVSSLHLSNRQPAYGLQAVQYYSEAVHSLRDLVESRTLNGSNEDLIRAIVWLYIFEIWAMRQRQPCQSAMHIEAGIKILHLRKSQLAFHPGVVPSPWERLIAESLLFNSATMALFDPKLASVSITKLHDILEPFLSIPALPDSSPIANSPVLGFPAEIYFIALEVSQLSYQLPLGRFDFVRALRLEKQLEDLDLIKPSSGCQVSSRINQAARLYILAAKILLSRILRPHKLVIDPKMENYLSSAIEIIREDGMEISCGQYFTWPVFIISCAVDSLDLLQIIQRWMQKIWLKSSSGNVFFILQVLDTISEKITAGVELDMLYLLRRCV